MKSHKQIPVQEDEKDIQNQTQNQNINEDDVFVREKIEEVKKLNEDITKKVYSKEELENKQKQKKKKDKIGMKLMFVNTIIASFAVIIIVFHLKGYI